MYAYMVPSYPQLDGRPAGGIVTRNMSDGDHIREATTPMDDGTLLADCSCGEEYSVPQDGGDELEALEAERQRHIDNWNARIARGEL